LLSYVLFLYIYFVDGLSFIENILKAFIYY
jgi:hypothetical protein